MEIVAVTPVSYTSASADCQDEKTKEGDDTKMEISPTKPDIEIIKESICKKVDFKTIATKLDKTLKVKKIKVEKPRGEKRKFTEKSEPAEVKRKKKDDILKNCDKTTVAQIEKEQNKDVLLLSLPQTKLLPTKDNPVEIDSDVENRETQVKQKSKQMSARKSKAVANACKDTLDVLLKLGQDTLGSIDCSLKILKSYNFLNNKLIPMDTLMDLISLALETIKASEVIVSEREMNLTRIVSKLMMEMGNTPKSSRGRPGIVLVDAKAEPGGDQETPSTVTVSLEEAQQEENVTDQEKEKTEKCTLSVELEEETQPVEPKVEKSGKNFCITNYFKKLKKNVEGRDSNERFCSFSTKTDMTITPKLGGELKGERREKFEEEFNSQTCEVKNLFQQNPKYSGSEINKISRKSFLEKVVPEKRTKNDMGTIEINSESQTEELVEVECSSDTSEPVKGEKLGSSLPTRKKVTLVRVDQPKIVSIQAVSRTKAKLLQFHENRRPPYWGTWRRRSENVGPRKPFEKDKLLNYEIDSDDEWESEEEPGESLHGSDDEKEPEEDYEVDNDFFVPHGYLSDDENPEKEDVSPKMKLNLLEEQFTSELKEKTRKKTPFVFGTFWIHKDMPLEGNLYHDLQIDRLQIVPWTTIPIQIEDEDDKKNESIGEQGELSSATKKRQKTFPDEEIPNLIKMIHGSPQNCHQIARKFLLYWEGEKIQDGRRPGLTKVCVLKKIKELASWQTSQEKGKCWLVPEETRKEFGTYTEIESPAKKPPKCFIWKFVKRGEKTQGVVASTSPVSEPEVVVIES